MRRALRVLRRAVEYPLILLAAAVGAWGIVDRLIEAGHEELEREVERS